MTLGRLLLRNLFYHWRGNSAVALGVAVGTLVLTGALLVGDSLRGSLQDLTLQRLGWVDHALLAGRFVREELAGELAADSAGQRITPLLLLQGAASAEGPSAEEGLPGPITARVGQVAILGVEPRFWPDDQVPVDSAFWQSESSQVVLNTALAAALGVAPGSTVVLHVPRVSAVPQESQLGHREDATDRLRLTVCAVLPDQAFGNRFALTPSPATPRNAFVPLRTLQNELNQVGPGLPPSRKPRLHLQRPINGLLVGGGNSKLLATRLAGHLTLDDWGLVLRTPEERAGALFDTLDRYHHGLLTPSEWPRLNDRSFLQEIDRNHDGAVDRAEMIDHTRRHHDYLSLESRQFFIEPAIAGAAHEAARPIGLLDAPTLVYLADRIADPSGKKEIPYAVVAAVDPALPPPLGPFLPRGGQPFQENDLVLTEWPESPWSGGPASGEVIVQYYGPEEKDPSGELLSRRMTLRGGLPLQGAADDPSLAPNFPGITDQPTLKDWDPPADLHFNNKRITPRDEDYWKKYRTTPKAYVTLATGQELWSSRFGTLTSIRVARARGALGPDAAAAFTSALLQKLPPGQGGLVFDAVRQRGLDASDRGTDFGWLFVGFSTFLIAAALLLVGLLFRLNLDRRAGEIGLLLAAGYRRRTVRWLLLGEGGLLTLVGGAIGCAGAVFYAWLLLEFLRRWWPGTLDRSFLRIHLTAQSFVIGYFAALVVSGLTILWALRLLSRVSPSALLAGQTAEAPGHGRQPGRWSRWVAIGAAILAAACVLVGLKTHDHEMQASSFFGSGALLLTAGLTAIWTWMRCTRHHHIGGPGALAWLGVRNAARHPVRSLLTAGLLASATFLVVAVESFHREPNEDLLDQHSGSGGFALLAESSLPVYQDLNSDRVRRDLGFSEHDLAEMQPITFHPFRLQTGDDASCLNLYQPDHPRLLGVPPRLIARGGFAFQATEAHSKQDRDNPWGLLDQPISDGAIPVFGEANTVRWMLNSKLGGIKTVPNERGEPVPLRIVGLLQDSIFQSELLMSEANFLRLNPSHKGYNFFLVDTGSKNPREVLKLLGPLAQNGLEVTATAERLEGYLAVENTYLWTFQALGGLGLVLGALGLAVVLLRSVWERRGELALFRALGFRRLALGWLVLAENGFLLLMGLGVGVLAALAAVTPPLIEGTGAVPWLRLLILIGVVLVVGLVAGLAAVITTLRAPLLPALRRE